MGAEVVTAAGGARLDVGRRRWNLHGRTADSALVNAAHSRSYGCSRMRSSTANRATRSSGRSVTTTCSQAVDRAEERWAEHRISLDYVNALTGCDDKPLVFPHGAVGPKLSEAAGAVDPDASTIATEIIHLFLAEANCGR